MIAPTVCPSATAFCAPTDVAAPVAVNLRPTLSTIRKVSPEVRVRRDKEDAYPNAFGLPAGPAFSCPGATAFCAGCYAAANETQYPSVARKMRANWDALRACGDVHGALVNALDAMLAPWYVNTVKRGLPLTFRIHWDGDFYSAAYARAWGDICRAYPDVTFWAYTRSTFAVAHLVDVPNLALYASVDAENAETWRPLLAQYPRLHVAACGRTFEDGAALLAQLGRGRAPVCPEGVTLPLVVAQNGRRSVKVLPGETGQGACNACGYCLVGRGDIRFATHKGQR